MELGAGRKVKGEPIDHAVGIVLQTDVGDAVEPGATLATIHTDGHIPANEAASRLLTAFQVGPEPPLHRPHVLEVVTD
jgi:thymidine phosphorylase